MANHEVPLSIVSKEPKFFYGYIIVLAGFLVMMILFGIAYSFGVFFKPVLAEFGWTRAMTSGAYSLFMILHALQDIVAGRLSDRFGPRLVVTVCGLFFGLGYLLMSQVSSIWQLYLFYSVLGSIGMSAFIPVMTTVNRWFVKRRGLMSGIVVSGIGVGAIIMPPAATWLISIYNWRTSYAIIGGIAFVIMVIAAQFLRRDPGQVGLLSDGAGEAKAEDPGSGARGFSFQEAIRTRQFWLFSVAFFLFLFLQQIIMVHIVPHATDLGVSAASAAGILSIIGGLSIVGKISMGSASDRIGYKAVLIIVLVLVAFALFWLQLAREEWMFYLFALVFGFGYGGAVVLESPIVAKLFGLRSLGAILGMFGFICTIGGGIGPVIAGRIFDITGSYQLVFLLCALLSVIALILVSLSRPTRRESLTENI